jgi:3-dehydroquinate dehydratase I
MTIPYCLPIIKNTRQDIIQTIEANIADYQFVEVWLDYVDDLDETFVKNLVNSYGGKLILLFRRQKLETPIMAQEERNRYLSLVNGAQSYLDFDIRTQQADLTFIKQNNVRTRLLLSYHNYDQTPETETLHGVLKEMAEYSPAIYKIATMCANESDALRLLSILLKLKSEQKSYIMLGMGEHGMITRVFGTLWGNAMIFAPKTIDESSAPGQLTKGQLEEVFKQLSI